MEYCIRVLQFCTIGMLLGKRQPLSEDVADSSKSNDGLEDATAMFVGTPEAMSNVSATQPVVRLRIRSTGYFGAGRDRASLQCTLFEAANSTGAEVCGEVVAQATRA